MAEASIPVDLRNPGQVFACLGFMEAVEQLWGRERPRSIPVGGRFTWMDGNATANFTIDAPGDDDPVAEVIGFLAKAEACALNAPRVRGSDVPYSAAGWKVATERFDQDDECAFPFMPPGSPAPLPVRLADASRSVLIAHWGDEPFVMGRDNVKLWAGSGGYPALARDALALVQGLGGNALAEATSDPFNVSAPQSSSFSFDWRRSYVPLDAGFSPNEHGGSVRMVGYPLVELLAAIGLQNARPARPDPRNKLAYRYAVSSARLPLILARPVLGGEDLGFPVRRFRIQLGWPGQEGQARCIIDSREEPQ